jgi:hypothetical protein
MPDITGAKPVTNATVSTNITIKIGKWVIGYIRSITETQARPATAQYEVGSVGPIDLIPGQPAAVTIACTKVAIYGANLINIIARAINSDSVAVAGGTIQPAPGLSADETKQALSHWLAQRQAATTTGDLTKVFSLADIPVGFTLEVDEVFAGDPTKVMKTKYINSWVVRYTRPITSTGDLLVAETCDINAQTVTYSSDRVVTSDNVEIVS